MLLAAAVLKRCLVREKFALFHAEDRTGHFRHNESSGDEQIEQRRKDRYIAGQYSIVMLALWTMREIVHQLVADPTCVGLTTDFRAVCLMRTCRQLLAVK